AVNYANIVRSDYVSHAFADRTFSGERLRGVTSTKLIERMDALRLCIQMLPGWSSEVSHTRLWLVHAEEVAAAPPPVAAALRGRPGYGYEFVVPSGSPQPAQQANRLLLDWKERYVCYVSGNAVSWAKAEAGPFN